MSGGHAGVHTVIIQLVFSDNGDFAAFFIDPQTLARNSLPMHSQGEI